VADRLQDAGSLPFGLFVLIAVLTIPALFIVGAEWLSQRVLPWFVLASVLVLAFLIIVLLPLAAFQRFRPFASEAIVIVSYVFGVTVWMEGLLLTMALWGTFAVVLGLVIAGVGLVPIAMLATLFNGMWAGLAELVVLTLLTLGSRLFAVWVASKADASSEAVDGALTAW
jgi:hypothetical protein